MTGNDVTCDECGAQIGAKCTFPDWNHPQPPPDYHRSRTEKAMKADSATE